MKFIKVFGMERTGTVWMQQLIRFNFYDTNALSNMFGWKHGKVRNVEEWLNTNPESDAMARTIYEMSKNIPTIIMVKNPYHWRASIERWVKNCVGCREWDFDYYFKRYNEHYLSWHRDLIENNHGFFSPAVVVKYEDLLSSLIKELVRISKITEFVLNDEIYSPMKVPQSAWFDEEKQKYYLSPAQLPDEERKRINELVSDEFFKLYNYERI